MTFISQQKIVLIAAVCFISGISTDVIDDCPDYEERKIIFYCYNRTSDSFEQVIPGTVGDIPDTLSTYDTKIVVHGARESAKSTSPIYWGYTKDADHLNICVVDWSAYGYCGEDIFHTIIREISTTVAAFLVELLDLGISKDQIHIIAFGLGADIGGVASRNKSVGTVARISVLELFSIPVLYEDDQIKNTDAVFIDSIFTSSLSSTPEDIADVAFIVNDGQVQPGCEGENEVKCSHLRAIDYFGESITSEVGFYGTKCDLIATVTGEENSSDETEIMGAYTPSSARGKYCVKTNRKPPYARGKFNN